MLSDVVTLNGKCEEPCVPHKFLSVSELMADVPGNVKRFQSADEGTLMGSASNDKLVADVLSSSPPCGSSDREEESLVSCGEPSEMFFSAGSEYEVQRSISSIGLLELADDDRDRNRLTPRQAITPTEKASRGRSQSIFLAPFGALGRGMEFLRIKQGAGASTEAYEKTDFSYWRDSDLKPQFGEQYTHQKRPSRDVSASSMILTNAFSRVPVSICPPISRVAERLCDNRDQGSLPLAGGTHNTAGKTLEEINVTNRLSEHLRVKLPERQDGRTRRDPVESPNPLSSYGESNKLHPGGNFARGRRLSHRELSVFEQLLYNTQSYCGLSPQVVSRLQQQTEAFEMNWTPIRTLSYFVQDHASRCPNITRWPGENDSGRLLDYKYRVKCGCPFERCVSFFVAPFHFQAFKSRVTPVNQKQRVGFEDSCGEEETSSGEEELLMTVERTRKMQPEVCITYPETPPVLTPSGSTELSDSLSLSQLTRLSMQSNNRLAAKRLSQVQPSGGSLPVVVVTTDCATPTQKLTGVNEEDARNKMDEGKLGDEADSNAESRRFFQRKDEANVSPDRSYLRNVTGDVWLRSKSCARGEVPRLNLVIFFGGKDMLALNWLVMVDAWLQRELQQHAKKVELSNPKVENDKTKNTKGEPSALRKDGRFSTPQTRDNQVASGALLKHTNRHLEVALQSTTEKVGVNPLLNHRRRSSFRGVNLATLLPSPNASGEKKNSGSAVASVGAGICNSTTAGNGIEEDVCSSRKPTLRRGSTTSYTSAVSSDSQGGLRTLEGFVEEYLGQMTSSNKSTADVTEADKEGMTLLSNQSVGSNLSLLTQVAFAMVEYPGYGFGMGLPSPSSCVESGLETIRNIIEHAQPTSVDLHVIGYSLGSAIALRVVNIIADEVVAIANLEKNNARNLARNSLEPLHRIRSVKNLTLIAPFTSTLECVTALLRVPRGLRGMSEYILDAVSSKQCQYDNCAALGRLATLIRSEPEIFKGFRCTIVFGDQDKIVPFSMGPQLAAHMRRSFGKEFLREGKVSVKCVRVPGTDHSTILIANRLVKILQRYHNFSEFVTSL